MGNCEREGNTKSTIDPCQFSPKDKQKVQNQPSDRTHYSLLFQKDQDKYKENMQEFSHEMQLESTVNVSDDQSLSATTLDTEYKPKISLGIGNDRGKSTNVTRCQALSAKEIRRYLAQVRLQKQ